MPTKLCDGSQIEEHLDNNVQELKIQIMNTDSEEWQESEISSNLQSFEQILPLALPFILY